MIAPQDGSHPGAARDPAALFAPLVVGGALTLPNRVVMAPMTREKAPGGVPTAEMAAYYRRRAAGGVGLIITEGTPPDAAGAFGAAVPRFHGEDALAGWARVVAEVHAAGAHIMPQLWHVGAFHPSLIGMRDTLASGVTRLSPSGLSGPGQVVGAPMTVPEIERTIAAFGAAAEAARRLGFDGVEIHGAHGYLLDQFFWSATNRRTDRYGGDLAGRTRFAAELVRECRRRAGAGFAISLRFSQWKQLDYAARLAATPAELEAFLAPLVDAGVDIFHCSTRRWWEPEFAGSALGLAAWTRRLSGKPVIAVGAVSLSNEFKSPQGKLHAAIVPGALDLLLASIERSDFDLVALGRALLANPDWAAKVRDGRVHELRAFSREMLQALT
jgi:2,4-dienoyl-CoA reductase-like NADH-dependent reductase (Old Yellow Enzyme family)